MRVIVHVEGVVDVEEPCNDELECLLIYSQMLEKYEDDLGFCYGLSLQERVKCTHGYVEIKR